MKLRPILALLTLLVAATSIFAEDIPRTLIQNRGSDSMAIAILAWAEEYKNVSPTTGVAVSGGGTGTGIASLLNGTVDVANASRAMTRREINLARERGIAPVQHIVGYDAIAFYVHRDNPIKSLDFSQIAGIYGADGAIERWTDLDVEIPGCGGQNIVRVGRQNSSGTYGYLRQHVLEGARYRQGNLESQASKDLVGLVGKTPCAIGYSSFAYTTADVVTLCISEAAGEPCIIPTIGDIVERTYPLSRPLYMYTNGPATGAVKDYLNWILSDQGQCILLHKQYAPIRDLSCQ